MFQRRDGRWEGRWRAPNDGTGERPWIRVFQPSEGRAHDELADAIKAHKAGNRTGDAKMTVEEYLTSWWVGKAPTLKGGLSGNTARGYSTAIRVWIVPRIGAYPIGSLTGRHVQNMINSVVLDVGKPAAVSAHACLRKALRDAKVIDKVIKTNVAQDATPPQVRRRVPEPWTLDDAVGFLHDMEGHPDEALYVTSAMIGPRPAETLGLRWSRVDLDAATLTIDTVIAWPSGGDPYLDEPKSEAGTRIIGLPPRVVDALRSHQAAQEAHKSKVGARYDDPAGLVFTESDGRPRRIDTTGKRFKRLHKALGYRQVRMYDLRRLAAALIIAATDGDLEAARRILGHSDIRMVTRYGYTIGDQRRNVAIATERLLGHRSRTDTPSDTSQTAVVGAR